jgi:hypothetical protein
MNGLIAVADSLSALDFSFRKRAALLFDRIAIPQVHDGATRAWVKEKPEHCNELLWLMENGIVFEPILTPEFLEDGQILQDAELAINTLKKLMRLVVGDNDNLDTASSTVHEYLADPNLSREMKLKFLGEYLVGNSYLVRMWGSVLRKQGLSAYPLLPVAIPNSRENSKTNVVEIVLKSLPMPSEDTAWEQIFEYRDDPDSIAKFLDLRNWMNDVARAKLTPTEVEEKLEYLVSQFERNMKLHKMKTEAGIIETTVVSTAEFLEDMVKFKWGKIAKAAFSFRQKKIALMEGELTAPGSEVAYIVKAKDTFGN